MNDFLGSARESVRAAEMQVRTLIENALTEQRYAELAKLAPIAAGLLALLRSAGEANGAEPLPEVNSASVRQDAAAPSRAGDRHGVGDLPRQEHVYPRFERHGNRLVKIAWSKKDRREYEHRAPAELVFRIAELFERDTKQAKPFLVDDLMPLKTRGGDEIPSYQVYLALAWFRSLGLIDARGKDGYALATDQLRDRVEREWKRMAHDLHK